jgi:filamentous hemagglutinin
MTDAIRRFAGKSTDEIIAAARNIIPNKGFNSFDELKAYLGSPGDGCQWHHLVEQSQITRSGFGTQDINNLQNIVSLPSGS